MKKKRKRPAKLCGAKLVDGSGRTCEQPAGWGTGTGRGRCKKHGGMTPSHRAAAKRAAAMEAVAAYDLDVSIEPADALLQEVRRSYAVVEYLAGVYRSKTQAELAAAPWIRTDFRAERRHHANVCVRTLAAGIDERLIRIHEQEAAIFAAALRGMFEDLGVADHPKLGKIVRKHLTLIQGGAA